MNASSFTRTWSASLALCLCAVSHLPAQDTELSNNRSAVKLTFGAGDGSDRGSAYAEEYFYHDKTVWDQKTVYIKDTTPIAMQIVLAEIAVANGGDGTTPETASIRYRVDRDMAAGGPWWDAVTHPRYSEPVTFKGLEFAPGVPVVGTTGPVPGVVPSHATKSQYYWRGSVDSAGDEYHTIQVAGYVSEAEAKKDGDYVATDGKFWTFVVNPKTPCLTVRATGDAQFYTTPIKNYHLPKIFDQTTYFNAGSGAVTFEIRDINGNQVYYRINGQEYKTDGKSSITLRDSQFRVGENLLEYYYKGRENHVKKRRVIKNPGFPSAGEKHGNLLWGDSHLLKNFRLRRQKDPIASGYWKRLQTNATEHQCTSGYAMSGRRQIPRGTLIAAFNAHELGLTAQPANAGGRTWAQFAKQFLLMNLCRIDPVGLEIQPSGIALPSREIKDRGYYVVGVRGHFMETIFAYDLLISIFRSDQAPGGITPIEDLYLRDCFARWQVFCSCELGFYYNGSISSTNMWERAQYMAAQIITLAMPSYSTPHGGTSGWDGNTTVYQGIPYPEQGYTWKALFIDESNATPGFPEAHQRANYDRLFTGPGATSNSDNVVIDQAWADRLAYADQTLMGFPVGVASMMAKLHTGKSYPNWFAVIDRGKAGQLYAYKKTATEPVSAYGPQTWRLCFISNSLFPTNTLQHVSWFKQDARRLDDAVKYGWVFTALYFDTGYDVATKPDPVDGVVGETE